MKLTNRRNIMTILDWRRMRYSLPKNLLNAKGRTDFIQTQLVDTTYPFVPTFRTERAWLYATRVRQALVFLLHPPTSEVLLL
jgi:hypothetical protein